MSGLLDPFNRAFLDKKASEHPLDALYARLGALRKAHAALSTGAVSILAPNADTLCIVRLIRGGKDEFGEEAENECLVTLVNRAQEARFLAVDLLREGFGFDEEALRTLQTASPETAEPICGTIPAEIRDGILTATIPAGEGEIFILR